MLLSIKYQNILTRFLSNTFSSSLLFITDFLCVLLFSFTYHVRIQARKN